MSDRGTPHAGTVLLAHDAGSPPLAEVAAALEAWSIPYVNAEIGKGLSQLGALDGAIAICRGAAGWARRAQALESTGAAVIVWGPIEGEGPPVECSADLPQLMAAIFRTQGRLKGLADRGRQARALFERAHSAELVSRFAQAIAAQFTVPQVVKTAIAKTRELCEADGASLLLIDPTSGDLYFDVVEGGASGRMERIQLRPGQGIAGKVAMQAEPRLVSDAQTCPDFDRSMDRHTGFRTGSIVAVPLLLGGDVLGVLEAVRTTGRAPFEARHLERLTELAPHVAVAVHNAQITAELRQAQIEVRSANQDLERKVSERTEQISKAKQEWERTFDAISEPIALQEGFVIRRANRAYAQRVGLPITQVPGRKCFELLAGRSSPCPQCPLLRGRGHELSAEIPIADDSTFRFSGYWMSDDGSDPRVVVHYKDVTQEKRLQEKLRESERLASVGQLASGAAHEINNPLGFVTSNLRTLREVLSELRPAISALAEAADRAQRGMKGEAVGLLSRLDEVDVAAIDDGLEMIDESLNGAQRVAEIVRGLRELSRLEIGRSEPCCVNSSVSRAVSAQPPESQAAIEVSLDATARASIPPLQLDQVLGHLLKNAQQAIGRGQRIYLRTESDEREVRIEVRDEGSGIAAEHLSRIFDPFFTTRGIGKGLGLGLTAAYGIVKRAGGEILVQSQVGRGSTFTVRLPRATRSERERRHEEEDSAHVPTSEPALA